jgi:hypothetical protein
MTEFLAFVRTRILGSGRGNPPSLAAIKTAADDARLFATSDAYVAAYQRALDALVDELLTIDVTKPEDRERAIYLLARAQQHQEIVRELRRAINAYEIAPKDLK